MINFIKLGIDTGGRTGGKLKTYCPQCRDRRKNKRDKSLAVDVDTGLYHCHYCGWSGCAAEKEAAWKHGANPVVIRTPRIATDLPDGKQTPCTAAHTEWFGRERGIPAEVLMAMHIASADEWMPGTGKKESCICFNYMEQGRRVNTKYRDMNKNFKLIPGAELIPYNIDGIAGTPECIITEGEIDALSFVTAGRTDVISVPGGANRNLSWIDRFVETHLEDKQVIYIAVDTDRKGDELRDELLRRLGATRCRIVPFAPGCKDANEQLLMHGPGSLLQALADAPEIPLEGVFTVDDVSADLRTLFENGLSGGADTGWANFDRLCTFELGRLCVLTGVPGCGKSEFVDELVVRLNLRHGWKAAFFSPENMPLPYHLRKLAEKISGKPFRQPFMPEALYTQCIGWLSENIASIFPRDNFTVANILSRAEELVRRQGTRIFVFDPLNAAAHLIPEGQRETQYLDTFLSMLVNFARRNQCLVILVAHPRKMNREAGHTREPVPTMYDIDGSAAFYNKADFGLVVERDRTVGVTRVHVQKVKFRHLGHPGVASFVYNTTNGRFQVCEEDTDTGTILKTEFENGCWLKGEDGKQGWIDGM